MRSHHDAREYYPPMSTNEAPTARVTTEESLLSNAPILVLFQLLTRGRDMNRYTSYLNFKLINVYVKCIILQNNNLREDIGHYVLLLMLLLTLTVPFPNLS